MSTTRNSVRPVADCNLPLLAHGGAHERLGERGGIGDLIVVLLVEDLVAPHHEELSLAAFDFFGRHA